MYHYNTCSQSIKDLPQKTASIAEKVMVVCIKKKVLYINRMHNLMPTDYTLSCV